MSKLFARFIVVLMIISMIVYTSERDNYVWNPDLVPHLENNETVNRDHKSKNKKK